VIHTREILFRGKRLDNGEWIEGDLCHGGKTYISYDEDFSAISHCGIDELVSSRFFEVDPSTVGQYTGLKDKNGKMAFEGDAIIAHYENANSADFTEQIIFHNGRFNAFIETDGCKMWAPLADGTPHLSRDKSVYMSEFEVIGNIRDNPELIP
jgi:uncharacterized phage protein (TIGR01671 family)